MADDDDIIKDKVESPDDELDGTADMSKMRTIFTRTNLCKSQQIISNPREDKKLIRINLKQCRKVFNCDQCPYTSHEI